MKFERIDHPLASQRVKGEGRLAVALRDGRTRIADLYQQGAAKIRLPDVAGDPLEAVLINTAGGMTGGDRLDWRFDVGAGACATFTTQACEKVYRAGQGRAETSLSLRVASGGHISWLPQETILYDRSSFARRLHVDLARDASALICESCLFGRRAMGESVATADYRDTWRVSREGRAIHAENLVLAGDVAAQLGRAAIGRGASASATILLVAADAGERLDAARAIVGDAGGVSAWSMSDGTGKLLARLLAGDGYALRRRLVPLLALLNGQAGLPKVWSL